MSCIRIRPVAPKTAWADRTCPYKQKSGRDAETESIKWATESRCKNL